MTVTSVLTVIAVILTLAYAVLNGFRDSSTAIAAAVRTRALTPVVAVVVAAFFAFLGTLATSGLSTALVDALKSAPNAPETVRHNDYGPLTVRGWLRYLDIHASMESKKIATR